MQAIDEINKEVYGEGLVLKLKETKFAVVGAGGLGGFVAMDLARLGAKFITIADNDFFEKSNMNRQLYANTETLGKKKAQIIQEEVKLLTEAEVTVITEKIDEGSISKLKDIDVIFDCVDNVAAKVLLEKYAIHNNKILVHGAVSQQVGQFAVIRSKEVLRNLYCKETNNKSINSVLLPQIISALQVNALILHFQGKIAYDKLFIIDMLNLDINSV